VPCLHYCYSRQDNVGANLVTLYHVALYSHMTFPGFVLQALG